MPVARTGAAITGYSRPGQVLVVVVEVVVVVSGGIVEEVVVVQSSSTAPSQSLSTLSPQISSVGNKS